MKVKELIKKLQTYPSDAIVQLNSCTNTGGSENISKIEMEDEYNQTVKHKMKGQIYIDLIGDSI